MDRDAINPNLENAAGLNLSELYAGKLTERNNRTKSKMISDP